MIMGIFSFSLYLILGVCSLPSVAQKLSWSEWSFIQSVLGYLGLAMGGIHTFLLLVNELCSDRKLACENFAPLDPEMQISKWVGRVPTRKSSRSVVCTLPLNASDDMNGTLYRNKRCDKLHLNRDMTKTND